SSLDGVHPQAEGQPARTDPGDEMRSAAWLALLFLFSLLPARAYASRAAVVDVDGSELREGPGTSYKVVDRLSKGAPVAASNEPIEGFYKVRTISGTIGFVAADVLVLQPIPSDDGSASNPPPMPTQMPAGGPPPATLANEGDFRG